MTVNGVTSAYNSYYSRQSSGVSRGGSLNDSIDLLVSEADLDGDEALSLEESGMDQERFSQFDTDGDGLITSAEILAFIKSRLREQPGAAPPPPPSSAEDLIAELDSDGDGGLSLEETGMPEERFDAADTNQDGIVSQAELEAAFQKDQAAMPVDGMASVAATSVFTPQQSYQSQQDQSWLNWLKHGDAQSLIGSSLFGQQDSKSIDLMA